jgi:hypothetical protein
MKHRVLPWTLSQHELRSTSKTRSRVILLDEFLTLDQIALVRSQDESIIKMTALLWRGFTHEEEPWRVELANNKLSSRMPPT